MMLHHAALWTSYMMYLLLLSYLCYQRVTIDF